MKSTFSRGPVFQLRFVIKSRVSTITITSDTQNKAGDQIARQTIAPFNQLLRLGRKVGMLQVTQPFSYLAALIGWSENNMWKLKFAKGNNPHQPVVHVILSRCW